MAFVNLALLTRGRTLYQFNAGRMTMRTPDVQFRQTDTLDVSPSDPRRLDLKEGNQVRVRSRYGEARMPVRIDSRVKSGDLLATFHSSSILLNNLTGPHRNKIEMTPECKVVAVRVERA